MINTVHASIQFYWYVSAEVEVSTGVWNTCHKIRCQNLLKLVK